VSGDGRYVNELAWIIIGGYESKNLDLLGSFRIS
jgi:hypothetical protein